MTANVNKWSKTAASNATADPDINWAEGQAPSTVNNSARANMQGIANYRDDTSGQLTLAGGTTVYTLTTNSVNSTLQDGLMVAAVVNAANTGATTLNVDGLGAKNVYKASASGITAIGSGDLTVDMHALFQYDASLNAAAGGWVLVNQLPPATTETVYVGGTSTGSANAHTVATLSPATPAFTLTAGNRIVFIAGFTNTAATTLVGLALTAKNIFKVGPGGVIALTGGEIVTGQLIEVIYDGTQYILMDNAVAETGPVTTLASSGTTDLGTIPSRNVSITGTTTITAFGSTAVTAFPLYFMTFTGALTLTHNATSLILPGGANITTTAGDSAIAMYLGSGNWRVIVYAPAAGAALDYQVFTANGTWTKPSGLTGNEIVKVMLWGGGGGGRTAANGGGGGGGGCQEITYRASDLSATEAVTVGTGGAAGSAGNPSIFKGVTAYGGGSAAGTGGGGGGGALSVGAVGGAGGGAGGEPAGGAATAGSSFGGGGGGTSTPGGNSYYGGGGGGYNNQAGGNSVYGGGGGGGATTGTAGTSIFGGAGSAGSAGTSSAGTAPGGGGGGGTTAGGAGARGECRVWVIKS